MNWHKHSDRHHTSDNGVWAATMLRRNVWRLTHLQPTPTPAGDYGSLTAAQNMASRLAAIIPEPQRAS